MKINVRNNFNECLNDEVRTKKGAYALARNRKFPAQNPLVHPLNTTSPSTPLLKARLHQAK